MLSGLLTQLPTTSVSSSFMRLTDGGGSVHYPSVIVGVFVFDRGGTLISLVTRSDLAVFIQLGTLSELGRLAKVLT